MHKTVWKNSEKTILKDYLIEQNLTGLNRARANKIFSQFRKKVMSIKLLANFCIAMVLLLPHRKIF